MDAFEGPMDYAIDTTSLWACGFSLSVIDEPSSQSYGVGSLNNKSLTNQGRYCCQGPVDFYLWVGSHVVRQDLDGKIIYCTNGLFVEIEQPPNHIGESKSEATRKTLPSGSTIEVIIRKKAKDGKPFYSIEFLLEPAE